MNHLPFVLVLAGCIMLFTFAFCVQHEEAHKQINTYFGVESNITYSLSGGITHIDSNFRNAEDRRFAYLAHSFNESIGYQLQTTQITILLFLLLIFSYYLFTKQN